MERVAHELLVSRTLIRSIWWLLSSLLPLLGFLRQVLLLGENHPILAERVAWSARITSNLFSLERIHRLLYGGQGIYWHCQANSRLIRYCELGSVPPTHRKYKIGDRWRTRWRWEEIWSYSILQVTRLHISARLFWQKAWDDHQEAVRELGASSPSTPRSQQRCQRTQDLSLIHWIWCRLCLSSWALCSGLPYSGQEVAIT